MDSSAHLRSDQTLARPAHRTMYALGRVQRAVPPWIQARDRSGRSPRDHIQIAATPSAARTSPLPPRLVREMPMPAIGPVTIVPKIAAWKRNQSNGLGGVQGRGKIESTTRTERAPTAPRDLAEILSLRRVSVFIGASNAWLSCGHGLPRDPDERHPACRQLQPIVGPRTLAPLLPGNLKRACGC